MFDRKEYMKKYGKVYWKNNREKEKERRKKRKEYFKQYRKKNCENKREYDKQYRECHQCRIERNQYLMNKYKTDIKFNLNKRMGYSMRLALKGNKNGRHWEDLVSYNSTQLKNHLQKTLPKNYTWQDYLNGDLHIDHRIPISVFNFTKSEHIGFRKCWSLKNLQLLPAKENIAKSNKLNKPFQPSLKICSP